MEECLTRLAKVIEPWPWIFRIDHNAIGRSLFHTHFYGIIV
jgi:hypothetical protein